MDESTTVLIGIITSLIVSLAPLVSNFSQKNSDNSSFIETLRKGLKSGQMTYSDLQHIAESWKQNRQAILFGLRKMLSHAISGDEDLANAVDAIRELIKEHEKNEPFAELPENISLQLADIQKNPDKDKINQLAASLSTLYISHQQNISKEKLWTKAGFTIGIIGVIWSVATFFIK